MDLILAAIGLGTPIMAAVTTAIIGMLVDLERKVNRISQYLNDRMGADF